MAPNLVQVHKKYSGNGVVFVGLTPESGDKKADTQAFVERFKIKWPTGYGAQKTIDAFGVSGFPTIFVIGADGKVAWNDEMGGELPDAIDEALAAAG